MSILEFVDSDYRTSGTSSNFLYEMDPKEYDSVCVISANIPKTYYLIQSVHNTVVFTENGTPRIITVPAGNYSVFDFITLMKTLLNTGGITYNITYNKFVAKLTITAAGGTLNSITFPSSSSLYRQFGFDYDTVNPVTANSITSVNVVLFQLTNIIFIRSDIHESTGSTLGGNILQSITAVNSPQMSSIGYQNSTDPNLLKKKYLKKPVVNFYITDADGFILDLGGSPVNIELLFFNYDDSHVVLKQKAYLDNLDSLQRGDAP
jgi:hypothetical protein